jgi:hypothetical protein
MGEDWGGVKRPPFATQAKLRTILLSWIVNDIKCIQWLQTRKIGAHIVIAGPEDPNGGARLPPAADRAETLSYLCEIIYDLKLMADNAGYKTLAAILAAALVEARVQGKDAKP